MVVTVRHVGGDAKTCRVLAAYEILRLKLRWGLKEETAGTYMLDLKTSKRHPRGYLVRAREVWVPEDREACLLVYYKLMQKARELGLARYR